MVLQNLQHTHRSTLIKISPKQEYNQEPPVSWVQYGLEHRHRASSLVVVLEALRVFRDKCWSFISCSSNLLVAGLLNELRGERLFFQD